MVGTGDNIVDLLCILLNHGLPDILAPKELGLLRLTCRQARAAVMQPYTTSA